MIEPTQLQAELEMEKRHLRIADDDLVAGRERLQRQEALLARMRTAGHQVDEGERLADLLRDTLDQWQQHRELIADRIVHLERAVAIAHAAQRPAV